MYIRSGLRELFYRRDELKIMSEHVSDRYGVPRWIVMIDAALSTFIYGTIYTEYEALGFWKRTPINRMTYVTVGWLLRNVINKYNNFEYRDFFRNKRKFNQVFGEFTQREMLDLEVVSDKEIDNFINKNNKIVLKKSDSYSGKMVKVLDLSIQLFDEIMDEIKSGKYDMIETYIENCKEMKELNSTSLNTIRIVTIHSENVFDVVSASLRIGAIGTKVDNVSQGGCCAMIDISTGKLVTKFIANAYRKVEGSQEGRDEIGFKIPYWEETINMVKSASKIIPEIHSVGWDVAITEKGPILIEGNESYHTDIMEMYFSNTEPGLKRVYKRSLKKVEQDLNKYTKSQNYGSC